MGRPRSAAPEKGPRLQDARLYDALHRGNPGDVEFYRSACVGADSILELGCGSGRILAAAAAEAATSWGLDLDRGLLALARRRLRDVNIGLLCGDMRRFSLRRKFDRILVPYSGLYCLLDEADLVGCLRCVADHLEPDGALVFDVYGADAMHGEPDTEGDCGSSVATKAAETGVESETRADGQGRGDWVASLQVDAGGDLRDSREVMAGSTESANAAGRLDVYEHTRWHRARQTLEVRYDYWGNEGSLVARREIPQRYLLTRQLRPLLNAAGLGPVAVWSDSEPVSLGSVVSDADLQAAGDADWLAVRATLL